MQARFPAIAAHLVATERHRCIKNIVAIHPHHSGLQSLGHTMSLADIPCPNTSGQTIARGIAQAHDFVHFAKRDHTNDRPEDLLLGDAHLVVHTVKHRGWEKIALGHFPFGKPLTPQDQTSTLIPSALDVTADTIVLFP